MTEPYWVDTESEDIDSSYSVLRGPDGFECFLGEPEDCTWTRDGWGAVARLNEQHARLQAAETRLDDLLGELEEISYGSFAGPGQMTAKWVDYDELMATVRRYRKPHPNQP